VGDFTRKTLDLENGLGSLTLVDVAVVEAVQVELGNRVVKAKAKRAVKTAKTSMLDATIEDSSNEEEHEEVFTLGRINTRSQTRVS
jgi:hypothetical protein